MKTYMQELKKQENEIMDSWKPGLLFQVDSFTIEKFKGNPAGIVFVDRDCDEKWMQNIAFEMNLSETAFVSPGKGVFHIRYFTPTTEVPLCGHATLAASHILYEKGWVGSEDNLLFQTPVGELSISKKGEGIAMNFPSSSPKRINLNKAFPDLVGFEPIEMYESDMGFTVALAGDEKQVLNAEPLFERLEENGLGDLLVTAESHRDDTDFVLRCFCPAHGINEDPVTGSAHCVLVPLWHEKLGKREFVSRQLSRRTGELQTKYLGERVEIRGQAVTVFEGELCR